MKENENTCKVVGRVERRREEYSKYLGETQILKTVCIYRENFRL